MAKSIKKKVGRPKGSKNKTSAKSKVSSTECVKKKREKRGKRGRPKGSKNKVKKISTESTESTKSVIKSKVSTESPVKKKVGRPRKERREGWQDVDDSNVKTYKLLGYCPDCHGMISNGDFEEGKKTIVICYKCRERSRVSQLLDELPSTERPKSKRDYLEGFTHVPVEEHTSSTDSDIPEEFEEFISKVDSFE